tara:strand:- start:3386 stop:4339 length:954 start_codon:yes stop_codon:yes gene_type:complete
MIKLKDILFEANENLEIHIYDFDGTIFGSPAKPSWWTGKGWWGNPKSLEPPIVPLKPGNEWWNGSVVSSAKKSISNKNVYAMLVTGRIDKHFRWRVPELLKQKGLNFDAVHLNPADTPTWKFKVELIGKYLKKFPKVKTLHMWEDRKEHIGHFKNVLKKNNIKGNVNLVKQFVRPPAVDSMPEHKGSVSIVDESYTAAVLDDKSINQIKKFWNFFLIHLKRKMPNVEGWEFNPHHMTIDMKSIPELQGDTVPLVAYEVGVSDMTIALKVKGYKVKSGLPHITIAVNRKAGGKPRMSKKIKNWEKIKPIKLQGVVEVL